MWSSRRSSRSSRSSRSCSSDLEAKLKPGAVLATNTSSLKYRGHRQAAERPGPADRPPFLQSGGAAAAGRGGARGAGRARRRCARRRLRHRHRQVPADREELPGFLVNRVLTPVHDGAVQRVAEGTPRTRSIEAARHLRHADGADRAHGHGRPRRLRTRSEPSLALARRRTIQLSRWSAPASSARRPAKASTCGRTASPKRGETEIRRRRARSSRPRAGRADDRRMRARACRQDRGQRRSRRCRRDLRHRLCAVPRRAAALPARARSARGRSSGRGLSEQARLQAIMSDKGMRRVAVLGGVRIPFCRSHTALCRAIKSRHADRRAQRPGRPVQRCTGAHIDEVVGGAVVTHAKDCNLAREAVLGSALAPTTPGITMMQACGTSLQARSASAPRSPPARSSAALRSAPTPRRDAPIVFKRSFAQRLVQLSPRAKLRREAWRVQGLLPGRACPTAALNVRAAHRPVDGRALRADGARNGESPREAEDLLAYESHKKAAEAYDQGFMDDLVIPCAGVFRDNNLRDDISLEKMAELKPAFDKAGAARSPPPTRRRSPTAPQPCCSPPRSGLRSAALPVQAYLTLGRSAANDFVGGRGASDGADRRRQRPAEASAT